MQTSWKKWKKLSTTEDQFIWEKTVLLILSMVLSHHSWAARKNLYSVFFPTQTPLPGK